MKDKIYLGTNADGERISLEKHKWDCDWYWAFGYIGNAGLHYHISSLIDHPARYCDTWTDVSHQFSETWLDQSQWWILRDLFIQAYAVQKAAEVYRYGGHQTPNAHDYGIPGLVTDADQFAASLNKHLSELLDSIWELLTDWKDNQ